MIGTLVQTGVIALVVGWSAASATQRLLPAVSRRAQAKVVDVLDRPSLPAWLRRVARRAQPTSTSGGSCGDGCSSCGGCAVAAAKPVDALPLVFHPRTKS
jgi:hypothetical protein